MRRGNDKTVMMIMFFVLGLLMAIAFHCWPMETINPAAVDGGIGGGRGGGYAVSSSPLALTATILFSPMHLHPAKTIGPPEGGGGGLWAWLWGYLVGKAIDPIVDCVAQDTCNQANGPVGGGGGGGNPGDNGGLGGGGGWARKVNTWTSSWMDSFTWKTQAAH
jgi:hypothetical protein